MTADKFLKNGNGQFTEDTALDSSAGAGSAGKIICLDSAGKINENMMPSGVSAATQVAKAGVGGLAANDVVYLHLVTTDLTADKADATDGSKRAMGYVKTIVNAGDNATVYLDGELPGTGLTPGAVYYLLATPGTVGTTAPTGTGKMVQPVGYAISETAIEFEPDKKPVILA